MGKKHVENVKKTKKNSIKCAKKTLFEQELRPVYPLEAD